MVCAYPGCGVILKASQKKYCCTKHHLDHQKLLRMNTPEAVKGHGKYNLIASDLQSKYAAIDRKYNDDDYDDYEV